MLSTDESGLGRIWGWLSCRSGLEDKGVPGGRPHGEQRPDVRAERPVAFHAEQPQLWEHMAPCSQEEASEDSI